MLVLWTLVLLSTIALTLAATIRTEVQSSVDLWDDLQAERLAKSGHELAAYLETRGIGTSAEDLRDLPVEPVIRNFSYRVRLDLGSIDLLLEGDNGRFDVSSSNQDALTRFFTVWTSDLTRAEQISDSLLDWIDSDDERRPLGAESAAYSGSGYLPRNGGLGAADLFLVKGLTLDDFFPSIMESSEGPTARDLLPRFLASTQTGNAINPNYASRVVLQSVPGMTPSLLDLVLERRRTAIFENREDFRLRTGVAPDSPLLSRLAFDRGGGPAITAIATLRGSLRVRTERRTQTTIRPRGWRSGMRLLSVLNLVERNLPAQ